MSDFGHILGENLSLSTSAISSVLSFYFYYYYCCPGFAKLGWSFGSTGMGLIEDSLFDRKARRFDERSIN